MSELSIIYYTENTLDPEIMGLCQRELIKAAEGKRIISISQKPIDFGENICLGDIGRSLDSWMTQIYVGVMMAKTKYVAMAEHDCLYSPEHFNLIPPRNKLCYNINRWYVNWDTGEYATRGRFKPMSQLIAEREIVLRAIGERWLMMQTGFPRTRQGANCESEPGMADMRPSFIKEKQAWCEKHFRKYERFRAEAIETKIPNLDIRHSTNITKAPKCVREPSGIFEAPYWGKWKDYLESSLH